MTASFPSVAHSQTLITGKSVEHPWPAGHLFESPGAHLTYRVVGPCCRLYDREQLPWPSCRIQWHSKEPSWRRIGRRFIADMATRKHPSYSVEIVGQSYRSEPVVMTLYTETLSSDLKNWWHTKRLKHTTQNTAPPLNQAQSMTAASAPAPAENKSPDIANNHLPQQHHKPVAIPPINSAAASSTTKSHTQTAERLQTSTLK
ncbi:MAG: hypothetical protein AAGC93_02695 [Cyanobacteria bacterium P01_F01_bin.53]